MTPRLDPIRPGPDTMNDLSALEESGLPLDAFDEPAVPALLPTTLPATLLGTPAGVGGAAVAGAASAAPVAASLLQIRTTAQSWVGVTDARGTALLGRTVLPGEAVGLDGPLPFKVRVGNASATALIFKGQPVDLAAFTIGNVARLELK